MSNIKRVFHPYYSWEEVSYNMWGDYNENKKEDTKKCLEFLNEIQEFSLYMYRVITEWGVSCEHNLTSGASNRVAWLGQAACALKLRVPEDVVRISWKDLSEEKKETMNTRAAMFIKLWEYNYDKK